MDSTKAIYLLLNHPGGCVICRVVEDDTNAICFEQMNKQTCIEQLHMDTHMPFPLPCLPFPQIKQRKRHCWKEGKKMEEKY